MFDASQQQGCGFDSRSGMFFSVELVCFYNQLLASMFNSCCGGVGALEQCFSTRGAWTPSGPWCDCWVSVGRRVFFIK